VKVVGLVFFDGCISGSRFVGFLCVGLLLIFLDRLFQRGLEAAEDVRLLGPRWTTLAR